LDYTLHYRSPHLLGLDADYSMSESYFSQGWPTFLVVGTDGIVRFHGFDPDRKLSALRRRLEELAPNTASAPKAMLAGDIALPAEALACRTAPRDRSPRLAFDKAGNPNVIYYSNREGTNAVYWRRHSQEGETAGEERLSPPHAESYAADCAFDADGTLWAVWCGLHRGCYDIYVQARHEGAKPVTRQLTQSDDDAMSPRIATGPGGVVTVAYYKWAMLRGTSRDRNIFSRTYDPSRKAWSDELEISPHVPEVEDHTDPDVVLDGAGRSWVVWAYDYHPELYQKRLAAAQPTIFAARAGSNTVSAPLLVGATGQFRDAIDLFPSAALDGQGKLWCAWDCSEPHRCIRLARLNSTGDRFDLVSTFGRNPEVCSTPELSAANSDLLLLAWSRRAGSGQWQGRVALLKAGLSIAETTLGDSADALFPQARQAPNGQYWVAYERAEPKGSKIILRNITAELVPKRR
jgi:hypothetical protein